MPQASSLVTNSMDSWAIRMLDSILQDYPRPAWTWHYEHGLLVKAALEVAKASGKPRYEQFVSEWVDHFVQTDGSIRTYRPEEYNLDQINPGKLLFHLYRASGKECYRRAIESLHRQLVEQPRISIGNFWHKKIYPHQIWLDGVYMAAPFEAEYAATFQRADLFDDLARQMIAIEQHTRDPLTGLLHHGWDESKAQRWAHPETGRSPSIWGRAIGWYAMALVDVLDLLPAQHARRSELTAILERLANGMIRYQDPVSGMWYQVVNHPERPGNYREASVSAMLAYAFTRAVRMNYLAPETLMAAERAYRGILENMIRIDVNGKLSLEGTCSVGGLGGDPYRDGSFDYYISEPVVSNDFKGVGPFILASLEMEAVRALRSAPAGL